MDLDSYLLKTQKTCSPAVTNSSSEKKKPKPKQKTHLIHFVLSFPNHYEIPKNHIVLLFYSPPLLTS